MSTQLILYPQSYQGQFSSTRTLSEYLVNGRFFTGLNSTTLWNTTAGNPSQDAILNSPPTSLGNWYRYTTTGAPWGNVAAPIVTSSNLVLSYNALAGVGHTGVYQRLSGLIVGAQYDVTININTYAGGASDLLTIEFYSGNNIQYNQAFGANVSQITATYTAQSTNDTFLIDYESTVGELIIGSMSITESASTPTLIYTDLYDGQVICDLYQEEDIPLTLSIDDFKNVAEQVKSYSKDFNLPATKRNNQIFNNMFEVTRADDGLIFNAYKQTQCVLKQDGFILFEGYLRLIDVKDKEGEISYNVNLYSEVIALADILKDRTFAELDFTELEHEYNKLQIYKSWDDTPNPSLVYTNPNTSGFRDDYTTLRYPFIDWDHQFIVAAAGGTATVGNPELTSLESAFRPCIQLKYLINKIFAASGFNYTSSFFDSADFEKLYMDFNWGGDGLPTPLNTYNGTWQKSASVPSNTNVGAYKELQLIPETVTGGLIDSTVPPNYNTSTYIITATTDNEIYNISYNFCIENTNGTFANLVKCRWLHTVGGVAQPDIDFQNLALGSFSGYYKGSFLILLNTGDTLSAQWYGSLSRQNEFASIISDAQFVVSSSLVTSAGILALRGELGQWDFLKGIMTMFNLVSMVDETDPNNILIEPYADIFIKNTNSGNTGNLTLAARSIEHDWTDKVDVSEMELKPLTDLNKNTIFKFAEDDDDYCFNVYKNSTSGRLYGSKVLPAGTEFTILEGTKEIIAEPFAATVSKPLDDQFSQFVTPAIYSMADDGTSEGFENAPRIFYNNGIKSTGASYYIPAQNGGTSANEVEFLQFSHLSTIPSLSLTTTDFFFESLQLLAGVGAPPADNLYSIYWQPYFKELYNPDTRTMILKVNLTPADLNTFKFYDTVFIKNRSFRVNKIEYKPNSLATVEFILIP